MERIYQQHWIELPKETRIHLAKVLDIPKSGITEIRDQSVIADGHTNEDLSVITVQKLAQYVGSPETLSFPRLWEITLSKCKYELHPPVGIIGEGILVDGNIPLIKKYCDTCESTKGRHRKGCPKFK